MGVNLVTGKVFLWDRRKHGEGFVFWCFSSGADLIIILNTLGDRGGSSVLSERDSICHNFRPVYVSMPALATVNTGVLHASGRCRPNTRATESREQWPRQMSGQGLGH